MKNHLLVARVLLSCAAHSQNLAAVLDIAAECPALAQCPSVSAKWRAEEAGTGFVVPGSFPAGGSQGRVVLANDPFIRRIGSRETVVLQKK